MKNLNKPLKITIIVVASLLALIILALGGFSAWQGFKHISFYKDAEKEFRIPGLWGGSVPQGFEYLPEIETFLYTGYHKDGVSPSMVYVIPEDGEGKDRKIELFEKDGSAFTSHVGGISVYGDYVYIADGKGVAIFELIDILNVDNKATQISYFENDFQVAFVEVKGDSLYLGNFYRAVDYETPESHHIVTPNGDKNTAMIYEYQLDPLTSYPASILPKRAFSITDAIQGMTFGEEGEIILSSSWGLTTSHLYVYDYTRAKTGTYALSENYEIELVYLDGYCMTSDIIAPPMAEEIVYHDGDIYIMSESASMKYIFGKITNGAWCYAYEYKDN